jgi:hypothetical protein
MAEPEAGILQHDEGREDAGVGEAREDQDHLPGGCSRRRHAVEAWAGELACASPF